MTFHIPLPPLRERTGDIPLLARYYIDAFNREFRKKIKGVTAEAISVLEKYHWPGNVREMRNVVERAMLLARGDKLEASDFNLIGGTSAPALFELPPQGVDLEDVEKQLLLQALSRADGNQTHAGQLLGLNRDQVRYRIEKFGLQKSELGHAHGQAR